MEKEKRGIKYIDSHDVNPSLLSLDGHISIRSRVVAGEILEKITNDDGVTITRQDKGYEITYFKDNRSFLKSYKMDDDIARNLSSVGLDMYFFIRSLLRKGIGSDVVTISKGAFMAYSKKKTFASYHRAILEMLEKEIIFRKRGSEYDFFINVDIMFNGSTEKLYERNKSAIEKLRDIYGSIKHGEIKPKL